MQKRHRFWADNPVPLGEILKGNLQNFVEAEPLLDNPLIVVMIVVGVVLVVVGLVVGIWFGCVRGKKDGTLRKTAIQFDDTVEKE